MIHCSECQASLKYPVFIDGVAYGTDCASRKFGIRIPVGLKDATKLVRAKDDLNASIQMHYDLFEQNKEWLMRVREAMIQARGHNEWEYKFLLNAMTTIGALNWCDTSDISKPFYLSAFDLEKLSEKQMATLNKILK